MDQSKILRPHLIKEKNLHKKVTKKKKITLRKKTINI